MSFFKKVIKKILGLSSDSSESLVLRMMVLSFVILFFWAYSSEIDQVVHAQGQIIASSKNHVIQVADGGVLVELKVKEGDHVKQGDILATLEKERALAAYEESYAKESSVKMTISRLIAELENKDLKLDKKLVKEFPEMAKSEINLFKKRQLAYKNQLSFLENSIKFQNEELQMNLKLESLGDVSRADILRLEKSVNDARGNFDAQRNKYIQDVSADLNKAREDLIAQHENVIDKTQLLKHTDLLSPSDGVVKSIHFTTLGGVLKSGDELMQILPTDSDLIIEAKVKPSDMAFIKEGLPVNVKLDAYDYSIFGVLNGKVSYISPDTLSEEGKSGSVSYYRVKVSVDQSSYKSKLDKKIEFRPGMTSTVDIRTGKRSVLKIILKPLTKTLKESFGEK
jgi:membrane fusion protein, adhesin transport system